MNWAVLSVNCAAQGIFITVAVYTQSVLGMSPLQSGLTVAPLSVMVALVSLPADRLSDRIGARWLVSAGLTLFGAGAAWEVLIATTTSQQGDFVPAFGVAGLGLGLALAPMSTTALRHVTREDAAPAAAVFNTTR